MTIQQVKKMFRDANRYEEGSQEFRDAMREAFQARDLLQERGIQFDAMDLSPMVKPKAWREE